MTTEQKNITEKISNKILLTGVTLDALLGNPSIVIAEEISKSQEYSLKFNPVHLGLVTTGLFISTVSNLTDDYTAKMCYKLSGTILCVGGTVGIITDLIRNYN